MLSEILETKDLDLNGYIEIQKEFSKLDMVDYKNIFSVLNNFRSSLYTYEYPLVLSALNLERNSVLYNPSKYLHGVYHVEKVFLYCYLMVKHYNSVLAQDERIPDEFAKILYYAALYHDVGRLDNSEDSFHGFNSAKAFQKLFKDEPFFKDNKYRLYLVGYLMNAHSRPDTVKDKLLFEDIFNLYEGTWEIPEDFWSYVGERYKYLKALLKDADALDRKRFGEWLRISLNPDYLRTDKSKDLIGFAGELNDLYVNLSKKNYVQVDLTKVERKDCFHSIGVDFFKIKSILTNGILSQDELKKNNILVPRNFLGGNFDYWISVVDASVYPEYVYRDSNSTDRYASSEFTHRGITFYCCDVPLILPKKKSEREEAIETGMPWDKSGYKDEKYAYSKISPENILGLFIPYEYKDKNVYDLRYIYESTNMDIIRNRVAYYKRYTLASNNSVESYDMVSLLDEYEKMTLVELDQPNGSGNSIEYLKKSEEIINKINHIIGIWIYDYYKEFLSSNFTITDVIVFELSRIPDIEFNVVDNFNSQNTEKKELFISVSKKKELENNKKISLIKKL